MVKTYDRTDQKTLSEPGRTLHFLRRLHHPGEPGNLCLRPQTSWNGHYCGGFVSVATAILFAYVVNKLFVFESRTPGIKALLIEFAQFVGARFLTMLIEVFGVLMLHDVWKMNDMAGQAGDSGGGHGGELHFQQAVCI